MSQKRRHHEAASGDSVAENPKKQRPNFEPRRKQLNSRGQKRGYNQSNASHDEPKADSTSALKSRIRDLRRLLDHVDKDLKHKMPAGVRIERERELATCEHELAEKQAAEREAEFRNKIIGKYHHIRFFERQKASRVVKRLNKQLSSVEDSPEREDLLRKIHNAEVDVSYTLYYPLLKPYVSLYPRQKTEQSTSTDPPANGKTNQQSAEPIDGPKGNIEIWRAVEQAMEDGTLETLRESKEGVTIPGPKDEIWKGRITKKDHKKLQIKDTKAAAPKEEVEESDGGFFE